MSLTKSQIGRYSRHLIMPEVGVQGQEKLANAISNNWDAQKLEDTRGDYE